MLDTGAMTVRPDGSVAIVGQYSGLNTETLIESTIAAKRLPADSLETKIDENTLESGTLTELDALLDSFQSIANGLRFPPGSTSLSNNVFENKAAYLTSSTATNPESVLRMDASNEAATGSFNIEVTQTAKANKLSTVGVFDRYAQLNITDALTIGLKGGKTAKIDILPTNSLSDMASSINAKTGITGVRASILQVSNTDYRLILTAEKTGEAIEIKGSSGAFMNKLGHSTGALEELQAAELAKFLLDGVAIERTSNEVDDVIEGVTIMLLRGDQGNSITIDIEQNLAKAKESIEALVEAYNALRSFYDAQRDYDPANTDAIEPPLYGSDILRDVIGDAAAIIGIGAIGVDQGQSSSLLSIGIGVNDEGYLQIDDGKLEAALITDPEAVQKLFEFTFEPSDSRLKVLSRDGDVNMGDFTLEIGGVDSNGNVISAMVNGQTVFEINGRTLKGKEGTDFEGIKLFWSGNNGSGPETVSVRSSIGVAEQFYNMLEEFVEPGTGRIDSRVLLLEETNTDHAEKIAKIDARLELTRQALIDQYARMERAIAELEAVRMQLAIFTDSDDD